MIHTSDLDNHSCSQDDKDGDDLSNRLPQMLEIYVMVHIMKMRHMGHESIGDGVRIIEFSSFFLDI